MNNFLDAANNIRRSRDAQFAAGEKDRFDLVFKAINALSAAHSKAALDTDNLESVFGAFEMARLTGRLDSLSAAEVEALNPSMRSLIVGTLGRSIRLPVEDGRVVVPPRPYADFYRLIEKLAASNLGPVSFITFNYDLNLDYTVHVNNDVVDYCFDDKPAVGVPVMKLHGSVNWARCAGCSKIVPWALRAFFQGRSWGRALMAQPQTVSLDVAEAIGAYVHCTGHACDAAPVIVPPTWNKAEYQQVASVWKHAGQHLAEAENIIVIGYSLPETDQFFRYLFALGTIGESRPQRFRVIDPDAQVGKRFEALLGPAFRSRFRQYRNTFSHGLGELWPDLGLA